jgi:uncharacterized phage-associated protein
MQTQKAAREKLLHSILYFVKNTKYCNITKLMKLLYLLDFNHYKETGRSVTGLPYYTFKFGPVPRDIYNELNDDGQNSDIHNYFSINKVEYNNKPVTTISPKRTFNFNPQVFTKRELNLLENISMICKDVTSLPMVELSHTKDKPWDITMKEEGLNSYIDYNLILDESSISLEEIEDRHTEHEEMVQLLNRI